MDRIALLTKNQVWDEQRGCFFVGLRMLGSREHEAPKWYRGYPVMVDRFGKRIAIAS